MKIPYYVVVSGRAYWRPKPYMTKLGFERVKLGEDGPMAWARAAELNRQWERVRQGLEHPPAAVVAGKLTPEQAESVVVYPRGSIGDGFRRYRATEVWAEKKPRTREDWWRAWRHIKPIFGDVRPLDVTLADMASLRTLIEKKISRREAHRTIKIWRALWQAMAALGMCNRDADPSFGVTNHAAKGRREVWTEGEVVRLVKHCWRTKRRGMAVALAIMWDSQLSPGDARQLAPGQIARNGDGAVFFTERGKTDVHVTGLLSRRTTTLLFAYLESLNFTLLPDTPMIRSAGHQTTAKGGRPRPSKPYDKDIFAKEFRRIRKEVFGQDDRRQMLDFRRSGAVEAIVGNATREKLGKVMGNGIAKSDELWETYVPLDVSLLKDVQDARKAGRQKLRGNEKRTEGPKRRAAEVQILDEVRAKSLK